MFFPWTPMDAALIGSALEQERQLKAMQAAGYSAAARTAGIEAKIDELSQKQAQSDAENLALKQELVRLTDALLEQQRAHEESMRQKVEFDDKLRLYSMQLISDGLTPIEADSQARSEIQFEHELSLASPYVEELMSNLTTDMKVVSEVEKSLVEFFTVIDTTREPKFNTEIFMVQRTLARELAAKKLSSLIWSTQNKNNKFVGDIVRIYKDINKHRESDSQSTLNSLEGRIKAIQSGTAFISKLYKLADKIRVLSSDETSRGAWPSEESLALRLDENNFPDFISCSLSGSDKHWKVLRQSTLEINAFKSSGNDREKAIIGFVAAAMQNQDDRALLDLLVAITTKKTLKNVISKISAKEQINNSDAVSAQLNSEEKMIIDRIVQNCLGQNNYENLADAYFLLLTFNQEIYETAALDKVTRKIIGVIRTDTSDKSKNLLNRLAENSDPRITQLLIKSGNSEAITKAMPEIENLDSTDDGDLIWAMAKVAQSKGQIQKAAELRERAKELKSVDAFCETATKAVKNRDLSKIAFLESFPRDTESSPEIGQILGAKYFLLGMQHLQNQEPLQAEADFQRASDFGISEAKTQLANLSSESSRAGGRKGPDQIGQGATNSQTSANTTETSNEPKGKFRRIIWWLALATIAYSVWKFS